MLRQLHLITVAPEPAHVDCPEMTMVAHMGAFLLHHLIAPTIVKVQIYHIQMQRLQSGRNIQTAGKLKNSVIGIWLPREDS